MYTKAWRLQGCQGRLLLWMWPSNMLRTCGFVVVTEGSCVFIAECRGDRCLYGHHDPLFQHGIHVSPGRFYEVCVLKLLGGSTRKSLQGHTEIWSTSWGESLAADTVYAGRSVCWWPRNADLKIEPDPPTGLFHEVVSTVISIITLNMTY